VTIPFVSGVLSADDVRSTAASIVAMQEPSGAIPWTVGEHVDVWNHLESAMALLVGGEVEAAEKAIDWVPTMQRSDGSWPMKIVNGIVEDDRGEVNMSAYLAVALWHHWLVKRDRAYVQGHWESVRRGLDWVLTLQLPFGGIQWTPEDDFCLLAGNSSIYQSLRAGIALADLLHDPQPEWELAAGRLGHAIRRHRELFADKSTFSMDWYYPALGGADRGSSALDRLAVRWDDFVVPDYGVRCVDTNPWVTGAETCELAMALDALGDHERALHLFTNMQVLRHENGSYWTGIVYDDPEKGAEHGPVMWPSEQTTYTAAAVILAADALGERYGASTPGSGIMRGTSLSDPSELALECGCSPASDHAFAR
jgi:hypothetical protein